MKTPEEIVREMRRIVHEAQTDPGSDVTLTTASKIHDWADALEASMQKPVATFHPSPEGNTDILMEWHVDRSIFQGKTNLYTLPPDAAEEIERLHEMVDATEAELLDTLHRANGYALEIERLRESCRRREDRATEASHQASVLANVCADQKKEIERLKKYAENRDFAYDAIDRYLRNNMGDEDYALFSAHLDALYAIPSDVAMEIERLKRDYNDLLYQVEQKHPDETRHETARRLIRAAQRQPAKAALAREEDK
jgi:hypothetical protein